MKVSFDRGLDKEDAVHMYYEIIILIHKKEKILKFVTIRTYLENIMLSKSGQAEKVKNQLSSLISET